MNLHDAKMKPSKTTYIDLLDSIGLAIETARQNAVNAVNTELVKANWEIGRHIVELNSTDRNGRSTKVIYWHDFPRI
jgi:hypothetical protein